MSQAEETLARLRAEAEEESEDDLEVEPEDEVEEAEVEEEPKAPAARKESSRDYVVLMSLGGDKYQLLADAVHASSGEAAILSFGDGLKAGAPHIAVPVRNWTVATPKVETKTTVTLE